MAGRRPLASELTPKPRPAFGCQLGTSLGEGRGDAADRTLTFTVEAETRGAPRAKCLGRKIRCPAKLNFRKFSALPPPFLVATHETSVSSPQRFLAPGTWPSRPTSPY